jgi:hypothetical protein
LNTEFTSLNSGDIGPTRRQSCTGSSAGSYHLSSRSSAARTHSPSGH